MEKNINYIKESLRGIYPDAEIDAFVSWIFSHLKSYSRVDLVLNKDEVLDKDDSDAIKRIVKRLRKKEPIQYILGSTYFCGLELEVAPGVLIPRPETEEIVESIRKEIGEEDAILDVGTGSGCIALSLKKYKPLTKVSACDVSEKALAIARSNGENNKLVVNFFLLDILKEGNLQTNYDVIVSNPPYVRKSEMRLMLSNVVDYEPHLALFVEDADALIFYKAIVGFAGKHLNRSGKLFFEINEALADEVKLLMEENGFTKVFVRQDLQGKDRLVGGEKLR